MVASFFTRTGCVIFLVYLLKAVHCQVAETYPPSENEYTSYSVEPSPSATEHPGGIITNNKLVFSRSKSPYWLRNDIIVERNAELVIEPGVVLKVEPQVGITVRGVLTAVGTENERIIFTSSEDASSKNLNLRDIRLVDGPSILAGRVQLFHNGEWRNVCTNSRNWTIADMETACRQLGFQGGSFFNWMDRQMPLKPRLLYEEPKCLGTETNIRQCDWTSRQLGSGVCDYHPDLAIRCLPRHDSPLPFWRGIRFENARFEKILALRNTLYVPTSLSKLQFASILFAGNGRDHNTTSALHVEGVPPGMDHIDVLDSAYNGINITQPEAPFKINNCTVRNNRGYGIFVNSSFGLAHVDGCTVNGNGADGIRFFRAEERPEEKPDQQNYQDFCTIASAFGQIYPVELFVDQDIFFNNPRVCNKDFSTKYGHVITLTFLKAETMRNDSAFIEVYDGSALNNRLLSAFPIRNYTRPQSITTTRNQIYIKFRADPRTKMFMYMRLTSGLSRSYDLNVSNSDVSDNNGRGIAVDNLRSQLHVYKSTVSKNSHVAGVHVTSGVGDVNVTESRVSFNEGDGVNITCTGGNRNISRSSISSNKGYGVAIWLNNTKETEYVFVNQSSVVQYSDIIRNLDIGVLHGNYCGEAYINITGNKFLNNLNDSLEIMTCWKQTINTTHLQIGHNVFEANKRIAVKISPALNLDAKLEFNHFKKGTFAGLLIKNKPLEEFNAIKTKILAEQNYFFQNTGMFVAHLGLSPYSEKQYMLFTRNFVKDNVITEPFQPEDGSVSQLVPRSRVAAPVVIASSNVDVFRNIIENPHSKYEIGSHLEDQSKVINCTYNWLGFATNEEKLFLRLFHRYDRYNLAKINFIPYLLHNSNPNTNKISPYQLYVPIFHTTNTNVVGGEIEGEETLIAGEYIVEKDINIRPNGKLTLEPGVTLRFPPSVGLMVGGRLEARGLGPDSIKFTLKEEIKHEPDNNETYVTEGLETLINPETDIVIEESKIPIRILGGKTEHEGRLQVKINNQWGTVCNYGWDIKDAALVCQQLGLVLHPNDWFLERNEIPNAGTSEPVIISNIQCDEFDIDITQCRAEKNGNFEQSCGHENDVGIRCYPVSWAGVRFGALAERSDLQYVTIEKSGLLDYATSSFKPALQIDFARQNFESIKVTDNYHDGLGIMYSDIYTDDSVNIVKNSEFSNNKGAGVAFKQLGLTVYGSTIENNHIGIRHDPILTGLQQRELAGWFSARYEEFNFSPYWIPQNAESIHLEQGQKKYLVTTKVTVDSISRTYYITCSSGFVIGVQLLNPIENRSTEQIAITDAVNYNGNSAIWDLKRDLTVFPTTSSSHGIILDYNSGTYAIGGTVIVISAVRAPVQNIYNRIVKGPVPTLTVQNTKIRRNNYGIHASYYNRYLNELGEHFLRKANETLKFIGCEISHNLQEAVFVHSPHWDLHKSNISEVTIMVNNSLITDNGRGFYHFSRDMRASNNLFHYIMQDDTIERNQAGGFDVRLPYVWQYNENFTHSVYMSNNTWRNNKNFGINIDGHFALVNITRSVFLENNCKEGLIMMKGMEKKMLINHNKIMNNNGKYMMQFNSDSQSEIIGNVPALFVYNELKQNKYMSMMRGFGVLQTYDDPSAVVGFKGIQKVAIRRNLFSENNLDYQLVAGIKTAKINNFLDASENWWGTSDEKQIEHTIFDFDDWNNHAIVKFRPYLLEGVFDASHSVSFESEKPVDLEHLGGRLYHDLTIPYRSTPYVVNSDITIMPKTTLTISCGVTMEFGPNVGILVLGSLKAQGGRECEIVMRPLSRSGNLETNKIERRRRELENFVAEDSIRLCQGRRCVDGKQELPNEGFLEYFNKTTLQWIPMCDPRFTERNAQVVCKELGFDPLNAYFDHDIRIEFHSNSLSRIWSWPEPLQCKGTESRYEDCPIRLNGQQFGHRHECKWNSKFVFIHCGRRNLPRRYDYWGGIRFADSEFEQNLYGHRIHDVTTHTTIQTEESVLEYVKIIGAGILHNEKSPAVQAIIKSPKISLVKISQAASHGINLISPMNTMNLLFNRVENTLGAGVNILTLTGEGRESDESSFTPLKDLNIPYNLFSLIDICDPSKEIRIEERVLVYYKYDNHPVNCVKIFRSAYNVKPLGFRLLQFNLFNSTNKYGIPDFISLHDGDIYNVTSKVVARITMRTGDEKRLFRTKMPSLSIKLFANGASSNYGFIAEVVTLPISAIGFNRDVQHNISHSVLNENKEGGLLYTSVGEVNPIVTIDRNQFRDNCKKLYGNFTTCKAAVDMNVQNTQTIFFRNNLVENNQGGLRIVADSRGSATSLKAWVHNNLFANNTYHPALYTEGRQSSPYQEITIYRNYFTRNVAPYDNNIVLKQVVSNFTYNYVKRNVGLQNLEISGFDRVRLPIYQTTSHNGFYHNHAIDVNKRSTVVAGTAGQSYVDNIFFNPDNDYEMIAVNRSLFEFNSTLELWKTRIDAVYNYWGFNTTLAVSGRIRDLSDDPRLLEVQYTPFYMNNATILDGKCPPGWNLVGDTCYMYIGAPMTFYEARAFCQADNATMPYLIGNTNYISLYDFLQKQQQWYPYSEKVWVQHIDSLNQCTLYAYQSISIDDCEQLHPFICEIDPKVFIDPLAWHGDVITVAVIGCFAIAILLIAIIGACWWSKSKYRQAQRLERRNSIRQSLHSLRSVGATPGGFSDMSYRRKAAQMSTRSTDTLTKSSDYKKMITTNGSIDSMEKSTYNSSIEDNQSYDIYEAHNPNPSAFTYNPTVEYHKSPSNFESTINPRHSYDLAFRNEGFRDNSTFASNSNYQSRAESVQDSTVTDQTPIINSESTTNTSYPPSEYYNTDTLPLNSTLGQSDSTLEMKKAISVSNGSYGYSKPNTKFLEELKNKTAAPKQPAYNLIDLPTPPDPPRHQDSSKSSPTYSEKLENINYSPDFNTVALEHPKERPHSTNVLETDFDEAPVERPMPKARSKSAALLETNFDYYEPETSPVLHHPISEASRSRSQPLETAM